MNQNLPNAPRSLKTVEPAKINELDVRPLLKAGQEPFSDILATIEKTSSDGAMRLRAPFEPKPLFRFLGNQGWSHWIERGEGDDWVIWFYRENANGPEDLPEIAKDLASSFPEIVSRLEVKGSEWVLDVRNMIPPEPMELTLAVARALPPDARLIQINQRFPKFLVPLLKEQGLTFDLLKETEEETRIEIRRLT